MMRERFYYFLFLRYVDDVRLILPALLKGCYWNWENFYFSTEQEEADVKAGMNTDEHRTTIQSTKAMCSMVSFLQFKGEDGLCLQMGNYQL